MILSATEAVYQWLLFLRGKNGGIVRNRGFSHIECSPKLLHVRRKLFQFFSTFPAFPTSEFSPKLFVTLLPKTSA